MVVHHASGLHEGVADRRAYEAEAALLQIFAHGVGFRRSRGNVFRPARDALHRLPAGELPDVRVEAAEFALHRKKRPRVRNGGGDFQPVANDARIGEQGAHFLRVVLRDFRGVEAVEDFAVALALPQDRFPAEPRLRALEDQEFEEHAVVVDGHTPFFVVVADHEVALRPMAPCAGSLGSPGAA